MDQAPKSRQLLDPESIGALRATGIPPGMEDQIGADEVPASPEEEAVLEQAATKIRRMIHGRKSRDYVVDMLNDRNVPVPQAVGRVAAQMVETIKEQAAAGKVELDDELLMNVGVIAAKELLDVGIAGGFYPLEEDTPEYDEALQQAVLEGVKAHGERVLASPKGATLSEEAQNVWAQKVAEEVDAGTADPEYLALARGGGQAQQRQLVEA